MGYFSTPNPAVNLDPAADGQLLINDGGALGSHPSLSFEKNRKLLVTKDLRAKGMLITGQNKVPKGTDLEKGELAFWFNPQAAQLMFLAKNQQGALISGTIQASVIL